MSDSVDAAWATADRLVARDQSATGVPARSLTVTRFSNTTGNTLTMKDFYHNSIKKHKNMLVLRLSIAKISARTTTNKYFVIYFE